MKGLVTVIALLFFFGACTESGVQLSKPSTFVKYFSDGQQDDAIDVVETSDHGFLILSHADSSLAGWGGINVTKTDLSGNVTWEKYFRRSKNLSPGDLRPSNFVAIKDITGADQGYVIVGTVQNRFFGARLFVLRIDLNGSFKDSISYRTKQFGDTSKFRLGVGEYVFGKGVAQSSNSTGDFFVVGQIVTADLVTPPVNKGQVVDMFFSQINGSTLDTVFTRTYGGGTTMLANRLYLDYPQTSAYWGGTRVDDQGLHMRFVKSGFNSQETQFDLSYPIGASGYTGADFCAYGYGFAFIGNNTPQNIAVANVGSDGNPIDTLKITSKSGLPLVGNSICSTSDGGLLLLASATVDSQGTNTDYDLIKVDANGKHQWEVAHGGKYPDVGARVLQSSDGGYVVLGTTTLANVKTVFLMKTDTQGNIQ